MGLPRLLTRSIRPPEDITPNENDPATHPPASVGPDQLVNPGDPSGVTLIGEATPSIAPPSILASAWSGWPAEWWPPQWGNGRRAQLTDTAWVCLDWNSSIFASMPPYLIGAASTLDSDWMGSPDPDLYDAGWPEFARALWWDFQLGEAFVLTTARYSTGWPARFHVVPPWFVNVEMDGGKRSYSIGDVNVTSDLLHLRYQGTVDDAHGHGPLEVGAGRLIAADVLARYATGIASSGGIPSSILTHPEELTAEQSALLQAQWVAARMSRLGEPAVLSGGVEWHPTQMNPAEMALHELQTFNETRIAVMLRVPPFLLSLPSGTDSMTYQNAQMVADFHWRAMLRPLVSQLVAGLSEFLLPRGTTIRVNQDAYVQPDPKTRAETAAIYHGIQDGEQSVLSVSEIREAENIRQPQGGPIVG